jgi:reversibly glycosylated polypeptide/UDP-arabinopyranose mutase
MSYEYAVVVPNHLPHLDVLTAWAAELDRPDVLVVVMQDTADEPAPPPYSAANVEIYHHSDVERELGADAWVIPRSTSACRSYGYLKAWQSGAPYILTLDNDCYPEGPEPYWLAGHRAALETPATLGWVNTIGPDLMARGFPYGIRDASPVALSHGLWSNVPDLDAATWLHNMALRLPPAAGSAVIPRGSYFPMCGMNLAWRRELTPAMYFGLFGPDHGFDQFDDIWAGVMVKKVCDHMGFAVRSGAPSVEHRKQSNVFVNMVKQAPGMAMNEHFWRTVDAIRLTADSVAGSYRQLVDGLPAAVTDEPPGWTAKFKAAARTWLELLA